MNFNYHSICIDEFTTIISTARNIGILIAYIVGATMSYTVIPCIFITVPILFAFGFMLLPNTPQYYLLKGQPEVIHFKNYFQAFKLIWIFFDSLILFLIIFI